MAKNSKPRQKPVPDDFDVGGADDAAPPEGTLAKGMPSDDTGDDELFEDDDAPAATPKKAKAAPTPPAKGEKKEAPAPADSPDPPVRKSKKKKPTTVVSLEDRDLSKMTKKARQTLAQWKGKDRSKLRDAFVRGTIAVGRKKFGHSSLMAGDETDKLVIGIPMFGGNEPADAKYPGCLALEFVLQQNVFPLGLILQLVAKPGIGKSALLAEFGRWFDIAGGALNTFENETKFNPKWYRSIMRKAFDMMPLYRCKSVEDWQRKLSFAISETRKSLIGTKEDPGPGRTMPFLFGVDSIMGKMSEDTQEKILGKLGLDGVRGTTGAGAAGRGFPIEALVITSYLKTIPQEMENWPFALVLVNHLKMGKDDNGNDERRKGGGQQVNFQESYEIELEKIGGPKKKIECLEFEGYPIRISCHKNSFGPGGRSVMTRLLWWEEEIDDEGNWEQKTVWDWDWSTVWLLNNVMNGEKTSARLRASLKKTGFHLECPSAAEIENKAWSRDLGMKSAKDAKSWAEVGAMIRRDPALMQKLRRALKINELPVLEGDYLAQLEEVKEALP